MPFPPPPRRPGQLPFGGEEEKTPVLTLVKLEARLTSLEYTLLGFVEAAKANTEAQTALNKTLIEAIRGPENEPKKGLQFVVAEMEHTYKLFHFVWRSLLVAGVLTAFAVLGKIALMVQAAKVGP